MTDPLPSILILAENPWERSTIAAVVAEAGLHPIAVADRPAAQAMLDTGCCHGTVLALSDAATRVLAAELHRSTPRVLTVLDDHAEPIEDPAVIVVRRPLDQRELLQATLELTLCGEEGEAQHDAGSRHTSAAELGILAAELACLAMREAGAVANGAGRVIHAMGRQLEHLGGALAATIRDRQSRRPASHK